MTTEEALTSAKQRLFNMQMTRRFYKCPPNMLTETIDFLKNTIEALEKQIPKKQDEHFIENEFGFFCCKETGKTIRYPIVSFTDLEFCPRCGQKIDWSEEK